MISDTRKQMDCAFLKRIDLSTFVGPRGPVDFNSDHAELPGKTYVFQKGNPNYKKKLNFQAENQKNRGVYELPY